MEDHSTKLVGLSRNCVRHPSAGLRTRIPLRLHRKAVHSTAEARCEALACGLGDAASRCCLAQVHLQSPVTTYQTCSCQTPGLKPSGSCRVQRHADNCSVYGPGLLRSCSGIGMATTKFIVRGQVRDGCPCQHPSAEETTHGQQGQGQRT